MSATVKLSIPTNDQSIEREREKERIKRIKCQIFVAGFI